MPKNNPPDIILSDMGSSPTVKSAGTHIYFYVDVTPITVMDLLLHTQDIQSEILRHSVVFDNTPAPIHLHINSGGGDLFSGLAAFDALRALKVPLHTHIEGLAASAATLLSLAGSKRTIGPTSFMLIHQLSSDIWGKFEEHKDAMANHTLQMDKLSKIYTLRSKIPLKKLEALLKRDLLLDAESCLRHKLVDEIR